MKSPTNPAGLFIQADKGQEARPTIWLMVDDLLRYWNSRDAHPAGVQRVCLEIFNSLDRAEYAFVKFCRINRNSGQVESVSLLDLRNMRRRAQDRQSYFNRRYARLGRVRRTLWSIWNFATAAIRNMANGIAFRRAAQTSSNCSDDESTFRRGDILVGIGAGWNDPQYVSCVAAAKARRGMRFALLVHDIIPFTHPQYCVPGHDKLFQDWFNQILGLTDLIFTSSNYCRSTLLELCDQSGLPKPLVEVIPFGAGLSSDHSAIAQGRVAKLPERYVLLVSTIEIRKNHILMLKIWRRLVKAYGAENVPALVFVGRLGWRIENLVTELRAAPRFLGGKVIHIKELSDSGLREAYAKCMFTVFPSLAEGWGLPVTESLEHGKLCICSNRASLPEAGGEYCDYFDPSDEDDCFAKIERAIFEPNYLDAKCKQIVERYNPRSWDAYAELFKSKLDGIFNNQVDQ